MSAFHAAGLRQQERELVAADPRQHVLGARGLLELGGDDGQHLVPGPVSRGVVDLLELVEVDQHERQRPAVSQRTRDLGLQPLVERAVIREARERVARRHLRQQAPVLGVAHGRAEQAREVAQALDGLSAERAGLDRRDRQQAPQPRPDVHRRDHRAAIAELVDRAVRLVVAHEHGLARRSEPLDVAAGLHRQPLADVVGRGAGAAVGTHDRHLGEPLEAQYAGRVGAEQLQRLDRHDVVDLVGGLLCRDHGGKTAQRGLLGGKHPVALGRLLGGGAQLQQAPLAQRNRSAEQHEGREHHRELGDQRLAVARVDERQRVDQAAADEVRDARLRRVEEGRVERDEQQQEAGGRLGAAE